MVVSAAPVNLPAADDLTPQDSSMGAQVDRPDMLGSGAGGCPIRSLRTRSGTSCTGVHTRTAGGQSLEDQSFGQQLGRFHSRNRRR